MGARNGTNDQFTLNRDQWTLTCKAVGAAAANPTGFKGLGFADTLPLVRTSSGKYTLTLKDKWAALLGYNIKVIDSTGLRHYECTVTSETVASTKIIVFEVYGAASTVAPTRSDLAVTDIVLIEVTLSNTAQVPNGN